MKGAAFGPVFAQDAQSTGSVSYLYRGKRYASLPEFTLRLARLEAEALHRSAFIGRPPCSSRSPHRDLAAAAISG